jgi:hypothetical protein
MLDCQKDFKLVNKPCLVNGYDYVLCSIMNTNINSNTGFNGKISKVVTGSLLVIGLFSIMSSLILYTILKYYTTDGFTNKI